VTSSPSVLWPPNHAMRDVTVNYAASDNCPLSCTLSVTSSEPVNGLGDGDAAPDWRVKDAHHEQLRAERSGLGHGRTYTTTVRCNDGTGNATSRNTTVSVPHDMGRFAPGSKYGVGRPVPVSSRGLDASGAAGSPSRRRPTSPIPGSRERRATDSSPDRPTPPRR
jgi:hypothetical protein